MICMYANYFLMDKSISDSIFPVRITHLRDTRIYTQRIWTMHTCKQVKEKILRWYNTIQWYKINNNDTISLPWHSRNKGILVLSCYVIATFAFANLEESRWWGEIHATYIYQGTKWQHNDHMWRSCINILVTCWKWAADVCPQNSSPHFPALFYELQRRVLHISCAWGISKSPPASLSVSAILSPVSKYAHL